MALGAVEFFFREGESSLEAVEGVGVAGRGGGASGGKHCLRKSLFVGLLVGLQWGKRVLLFG